MWLRESARRAEHARNATLAARPFKAIKYHGKWPFTRLLGMQVHFEPASMLRCTCRGASCAHDGLHLTPLTLAAYE